MSKLAVGAFATSLKEPGLGPGKVFCVGDQYVLVGFVDGSGTRILRRPQRQYVAPSEAPADQTPFAGWQVESTGDCKQVLPAATASSKKGSSGKKAPLVAEWTQEQALAKFLQHFPEGFRSEKYEDGERRWKWTSHLLWNELFPGSSLRETAMSDPRLAGERLMKVVQTKEAPLLARKGEIPMFNWAMREGAPQPYLLALADLLDAAEPDGECFERLVNALDSIPTRDAESKLRRWPIVTAAPFLARPDVFLFIKPKPTQDAARRLGVDLLYNATPTWEGYERMLGWGRQLLDVLRPHGARDMIDVQSFIWTIAEY
jgi:hypothetical protein